jgi:ABC-type multidrug transport system permease subunit
MAIANVATHVFDRFVMVDGFASNQYTLATWSLAQFSASTPYVVLGAVVFQAVFHWMAGINDSFESFIYLVFLVSVMIEPSVVILYWPLMDCNVL